MAQYVFSMAHTIFEPIWPKLQNSSKNSATQYTCKYTLYFYMYHSEQTEDPSHPDGLETALSITHIDENTH